NGNNTAFSSGHVAVWGNPSLYCIQVDDPVFMNDNFSDFTFKDGQASYSTDCACTVNIPDASFKSALLGELSINTNNNSEIECYEAAAYTGTIAVSSQSTPIEDLTGVEAFVNAVGLACDHNQIQNLNISSNTALTYLDCSFNPLSGLDVSANTALTTISASSTTIGALDVSTNTALQTLACGSNSISILNVSGNGALSQLDCRNNSISELDVSSNSELTLLVCSNNPISFLDVSNNTALVSLDCNGCSLSALDVTANPALQNFYCASNTSLASLNMQNGHNDQLQFFLANNNPALTCIQVDV
ncbi:MAG: hypothetical protein ABUL44_00035, partial [Flavobacterium sp.]